MILNLQLIFVYIILHGFGDEDYFCNPKRSSSPYSNFELDLY